MAAYGRCGKNESRDTDVGVLVFLHLEVDAHGPLFVSRRPVFRSKATIHSRRRDWRRSSGPLPASDGAFDPSEDRPDERCSLT